MSLIYKGCTHEDRNFLVIYKKKLNQFGEQIEEPTKLLCKDCYNDPSFVNDSDVNLVFNFQTGDLIK